MVGTHRYQDRAYVLHTRPYRNTSLLLEVFTRTHGRLSLIAKGAKRGKTPLASRLQAYSPLFIEWGGQNELMTLYKAETESRSPPALSGEAFYLGFYVNELLMRLLHRHDAHPELFDHYVACLTSLVQSQQKDIPLRYFELQLLESLGYAVNLLTEAESDEPVQGAVIYHYLIEQGPLRDTGQATETLTISGDTLIALAEQTLTNDKHRNEAKHLMRAVLDHYLGDRPLKARELIQSRKLWRASTIKSE